MKNKELDVEQALLICILVSSSDVRGSNPVKWTSFGNLEKPVSRWPILELDNYTKFNFDNNLEHREKILELFEKLVR